MAVNRVRGNEKSRTSRTAASSNNFKANFKAISEMKVELEVLRARVDRLERVASLDEENAVSLRAIDREQAKDEIRHLYSEGDTLYMSEVAEQLSLPDEMVVELWSSSVWSCREMGSYASMTVHYQPGDALRARQIVVTAESIRTDRRRVKITSDHTGMRARARGEAYAYIDLPLQSVPQRLRS